MARGVGSFRLKNDGCRYPAPCLLKCVVLAMGCFVLVFAQIVRGEPNIASEVAVEGQVKGELPQDQAEKKKPFPIGMDLNAFFAGPGLGAPIEVAPDLNGLPSDTGLNFWNFISVKYRMTEKIALDVQFQNQVVVTNAWEYRHQGQLFGISGELLSGENWELTGALNTVIPVPGLLGQINQDRGLALNPGAFAFFRYKPADSRWSVFTLLTPRFFFYTDREALSEQDKISERGLDAKPEYQIQINPTINYLFTEKVGGRFGVTIDYSKMVGWSSMRRNYMPIELGVTYDFTSDIQLYTYVWFSSPLDDGLREEQDAGNVPWWRSTSINLWLLAALF